MGTRRPHTNTFRAQTEFESTLLACLGLVNNVPALPAKISRLMLANSLNMFFVKRPQLLFVVVTGNSELLSTCLAQYLRQVSQFRFKLIANRRQLLYLRSQRFQSFLLQRGQY